MVLGGSLHWIFHSATRKFFDPKDGKSAMSRTFEGVLSVLQSRKDIKDQEGVISDYLHQAKALVRKLETDGFIYVDGRRNG